MANNVNNSLQGLKLKKQAFVIRVRNAAFHINHLFHTVSQGCSVIRLLITLHLSKSCKDGRFCFLFEILWRYPELSFALSKAEVVLLGNKVACRLSSLQLW